MRRIDNPFLNILPSLDLHGETALTSTILVKEFINDNIMLKNKEIVIIHGKGFGILKRAVHNYLKTDKRVVEYKIDNFNDGVTRVILGGF